MIETHLAPSRSDAAGLIRNEPVQARSAARLTALLDAAAAVIDEIGYERITTAMVAERAGASIGTVYRYFPDRIAVLQSLAARNAERISDRILADLADDRHRDALAALHGGLAALVDAFRSEPGFASLRFGDVIDLRPAEGSPAYAVLADRILEVLRTRFDVADDKAIVPALESTIVAIDALAARAFARDANGYAAILGEGPRITALLLGEYLSAR